MSREAVMDLLAKADRDEGLRQELDTIAEGSGDHAADLLAVAEKHSCRFTAEEFGDVVGALPQGGEGELSDDSLDGVVGGFALPDLRTKTIGTFARLRRVVGGAIPINIP